MDKKENKLKSFFNHLWYELEPIVTEFVIYSIVIFSFAIVAYFTEPYLDEKLRDTIHTIKWIVVISALSLFAFHTIVKIFVRMCVEIFLEGMEGVDKIRKSKKHTEQVNQEGVNDEETKDKDEQSKLILPSKPANFVELEEIQNVARVNVRKSRKRR